MAATNFDTELVEFTAVDEAYAFFSNYSNKTISFTLDPSISNMPTTVDMKELYGEWQILAAVFPPARSPAQSKDCSPTLYRAIVTGGKFYLYEKPKFNVQMNLLFPL